MKQSTLLASLAIVAAAGATVLLTIWPVYRSQSRTASTGASMVCSTDSRTMLEESGAGVFFYLMIPILLSVLGFLVAFFQLPRVLGWINAGVFGFLCFITGFSIGLLYMPSALLLLVSVALDERKDGRTEAASGPKAGTG